MKNILIVTMGLDIGGAETHIVELACSLKKRGYNIICASNGGVYVDTLAKYDIPHYNAPLTSKKPSSILRSYKILKDIVQKENIEIIHAHARIPAFICHVLCKNINIVLVTTVHGTYNTKFAFKTFTRWGQKTLAVSSDIKKYLLDNYTINEKNIKVTINGIDSLKFCKKQVDESIYEELAIPKEGEKIIYLGRINFDSGEYAFRLLNITPEILKNHPDASIIIIGSGDRINELRANAEKINLSLNRNAVIISGARTDIDRLLQIGDVVVCVSRAALEALSCEKQVLLANDFGYMGAFSKDKLESCIKNNFTCRGFKKPEDQVFLSDMLSMLSKSKDEIDEVGKFSRQVVISNYSVEKMTDDAISIYEGVENRSYGKKYDFLILGYYGFNNSGDDALLETVLKNLRELQRDLSFCVLSNLPHKCRKEFKVDSFHRFNIISVIKAIKNSRVLIYGGGNLIQDITSTKSLLYYSSILLIAQMFGTKTMLYSNGIGPVNNIINQKIVRKVLNNVDTITLRENVSYEFLKTLNISKPNIHITADATLTIDLPSEKRINKILKNEGIEDNTRFISVCLRNWPLNPPDFEKDMAVALDEISNKYNATIFFIPFHIPYDKQISVRISKLMKSKSLVLRHSYNAADLIGILSQSILVCGMRLHSIIFATAAMTKICGIVYDDKISGFFDTIQNTNCIDIEHFKKEAFLDLVDISMNQEETEMKKMYTLLKYKATQNSTYAIELLKHKNF